MLDLSWRFHPENQMLSDFVSFTRSVLGTITNRPFIPQSCVNKMLINKCECRTKNCCRISIPTQEQTATISLLSSRNIQIVSLRLKTVFGSAIFAGHNLASSYSNRTWQKKFCEELESIRRNKSWTGQLFWPLFLDS